MYIPSNVREKKKVTPPIMRLGILESQTQCSGSDAMGQEKKVSRRVKRLLKKEHGVISERKKTCCSSVPVEPFGYELSLQPPSSSLSQI